MTSYIYIYIRGKCNHIATLNLHTHLVGKQNVMSDYIQNHKTASHINTQHVDFKMHFLR